MNERNPLSYSRLIVLDTEFRGYRQSFTGLVVSNENLGLMHKVEAVHALILSYYSLRERGEPVHLSRGVRRLIDECRDDMYTELYMAQRNW